MFLSLPSCAICSSSKVVSRLGYEAAFPFSNLAIPQPRHESLAVAIAIDRVSILALQEQILIIKPMKNIQEVGHLQLKTEPHGGSNSEIKGIGTFWFVLAKSPLRDLSIARPPPVQIPTSFSHFMSLLSIHVATTSNTSASVVVSSGLQNSISSSIEEGPTM